ncbi:hypothetical protein [Bacillus sp. S14(2024)]|uniref:hypothetical protein n=1 Tax=Bacillus sp. S14(2024) TaxID=3162884 RepID=UPI003D24BB32
MLPTALDYAVRIVFFVLQTFTISIALKYLIQKKYINESALIWISTIVTMIGAGGIISSNTSLHLTQETVGFLGVSVMLNQLLFLYYIGLWAVKRFKELKILNKVLKFINIANFVLISIVYIGLLLFFVLSWFESSLE